MNFEQSLQSTPSLSIMHASEPDFEAQWDKAQAALPGHTIFYSSAFLRYDRLLFGPRLLGDDSFILKQNNEVIAIVPLYVFEDQGTLTYSYSGEHLRAPLFRSAPGSREFKGTLKVVLDQIEVMARKRQVRKYRVLIEPVEMLEARCFYNYFLPYGYEDEAAVCNVLDCRPDQEKLRLSLRKSYKFLIAKESKAYSVQCISSANFSHELCEEYRRLHFLAAGRETRPKETFYAMYEMIKDGKAFLVLVFDQLKKAVGACLFMKNGIYGYYGSAAMDPSLPAQSGVGHLAVWEGICRAKQDGCAFVDLGELLVRPDVTDKEKNIDLFKQGFGGHRMIMFRATKTFQYD